MITVFFNEDGYHVAGEGIEIARRCTPATTEQGDRIFLLQHHTYKVLYLALCELREAQVREDVMVYNDSRIIDELIGNTEPLDTACSEWLKTLQRDVIPKIRSVVFFRKQSTAKITQSLAASHSIMLDQIDRRQRQDIATREAKTHEANQKAGRKRRVDRFKQSWRGEQPNGK